MHLKCIFHDYFFTLLEGGRTMFTCLLVLNKSSLYILIIIIIVIRLLSPTLPCTYISRPRFCVFCTVRWQTLNVLLYCGSGPKKKWHFDEERRFTRQNVTLRCFATPAVHNKLEALVKTLSAEWRLLCVVPPALLWVNSSFLLKEVHEKCGFTAAPKSKSMVHVLHSATVHVSDIAAFAVGNRFQVQDRNLWSGSGSTLCTSLFGSCDHCNMLWVFFFSCVFFFFFSFFSLPVHLMNMATRSKRLFPEQDALEKTPTVPHSLIVSSDHVPRLETTLLMLFAETTSFSPTLTCWNHHILLFCHFPFSLPLVSFLNSFTILDCPI